MKYETKSLPYSLLFGRGYRYYTSTSVKFQDIRDNEIYYGGNDQVEFELSPGGREGAHMWREIGRVHLAEDRWEIQDLQRTWERKKELVRWPRWQIEWWFKRMSRSWSGQKKQRHASVSKHSGFSSKLKATIIIKNKLWCFWCNEVIFSACCWGLICRKHKRCIKRKEKTKQAGEVVKELEEV